MGDLTKAPEGMQLVSEVAIAWLCDNHPDAYDGFYERVDAIAANQKNGSDNEVK